MEMNGKRNHIINTGMQYALGKYSVVDSCE